MAFGLQPRSSLSAVMLDSTATRLLGDYPAGTNPSAAHAVHRRRFLQKNARMAERGPIIAFPWLTFHLLIGINETLQIQIGGFLLVLGFARGFYPDAARRRREFCREEYEEEEEEREEEEGR